MATAAAVAARAVGRRCIYSFLNGYKGKNANQLLQQNLLVSGCNATKVTPSSCFSTSMKKVDFNCGDSRLFEEITLKVRGSDEAVLDSYTQFVRRAANTLNLDVSGKIILPIHIEKRTLLKSPHVYKTSRVQYELRTHARMVQLRQMTGETADIFLEYIQRNLPEGVSMSVEQTELEIIPEFLQLPARDDA